MNFEEIFKPFIDSMQRFYENQSVIEDYFEEQLNQIRKSTEILNKYDINLGQQLSHFGERFQNFYKETPEQLIEIAQQGWFLDVDINLGMPSQISNLFRKKDYNEADNILIIYYEESLNYIKKELLGRHIKRGAIIDEAITCHLQGKYNVSVPTLLSQVDGICYDITGKKYFISSERKDIIKEFEKLSGHLIEIFLTPIKATVPVTASRKERQRFQCTLNRHEVMHGVVTDYGTKTNSLKSISMLKLFSDILYELGEK